MEVTEGDARSLDYDSKCSCKTSGQKHSEGG